MLFIALIILAAMTLSIIAASSSAARLVVKNWIFPCLIIASVVLGVIVGIVAALVASATDMLNECSGYLCEIGQLIYIIFGITVVTLIAAIALSIVYRKNIAALAKERKLLWIIIASVLAVPFAGFLLLFTDQLNRIM